MHVVQPRTCGRLLRAAQRLARERNAALDGAPAARRISRRHRRQALRRPRPQRVPLRRRSRALHAAARPGLLLYFSLVGVRNYRYSASIRVHTYGILRLLLISLILHPSSSPSFCISI